jgi:CheY-like chemotaxis protein
MKTGSRILVVDDNDDFRVMLATALGSHGFLVSQAANGEEALAAMTDLIPDMAIVDLDMPKMNGLEFSKRVKDAAPNFPIIMVTGYAQFYSAAEILSVGIDAFLQKPVPMDKLLDVINKV